MAMPVSARPLHARCLAPRLHLPVIFLVFQTLSRQALTFIHDPISGNAISPSHYFLSALALETSPSNPYRHPLEY